MTSSFNASSSWPALTVTVWVALQSVVVKVRDVGLTDTSVPAWPLTLMVTSAEGSVFSRTV